MVPRFSAHFQIPLPALALSLLVSLLSLTILSAGCDSKDTSTIQIRPENPDLSNASQQTNSASSIDQTSASENSSSMLISPEDIYRNRKAI